MHRNVKTVVAKLASNLAIIALMKGGAASLVRRWQNNGLLGSMDDVYCTRYDTFDSWVC